MFFESGWGRVLTIDIELQGSFKERNALGFQDFESKEPRERDVFRRPTFLSYHLYQRVMNGEVVPGF